MTIRETLAEGKRLLESPSSTSLIDTPALDASLLLSGILGASRTDLVVRGDEAVTVDEKEKYFRFLKRRLEGECVAYILGRREFRGLDFTVNHTVLVPRPDTETLVEAALEYVDGFSPAAAGRREKPFTVFDLCTGSGAVAVALKKERPSLSVTASDISAQALETARLNAARLLDAAPSGLSGGLDGRCAVGFIQSDLFENITDRFDMIVSNPQYVPAKEIDSLAPEVRREPRLALDGGADGLALIRWIIALAPDHLAPGGILILEADPRQMPAIGALFDSSDFGGVRIRRDLANRERVISAICG